MRNLVGNFVGKFSIPEGLSAGPHRLQRPSQDFHRSKCAAWYWSQVLHCDTRQPRTCTETVGSLWYRVRRSLTFSKALVRRTRPHERFVRGHPPLKKHNSESAFDEVHLVSVLGHDAQCSRISRRKKIVPKNSGKNLLPKPDP